MIALVERATLIEHIISRLVYDLLMNSIFGEMTILFWPLGCILYVKPTYSGGTETQALIWQKLLLC